MVEYSFQENFAESLPPERQNTGKSSNSAPFQMESNESEDEPVPCSEGDTYAAAEEVIEAVETAYKKDKNLQTKLIKYSDRKINEIIGGKNDGRLMPDDIAEEAVYRIISLKRKWYKTKVDRIENLILMVIVSLIRIEADKIMDLENQLYDEREDTSKKSTKNKGGKKRIIPLYFKDKEGGQGDTTIIDKEYYEKNNKAKYEDDFDFEMPDENELITRLENELDNDETAFFVFQEMLDGNKSNIDVASKLGIEVKDVENARKRIKRKALNITAK